MKSIIILLFLCVNLLAQDIILIGNPPTLVGADKDLGNIAVGTTHADSMTLSVVGRSVTIDSIKSDLTSLSLSGDSVITYYDSQNLRFTADISTLGSIDKDLIIYSSSSDGVDTVNVTGEVVTQILLAPTSLIATAQTGGINLMWTDSNPTTDTSLAQRYLDSTWTIESNSTNATFTNISDNKYKLLDAAGCTYGYPSYYRDFTLDSAKWYAWEVDIEPSGSFNAYLVFRDAVEDTLMSQKYSATTTTLKDTITDFGGTVRVYLQILGDTNDDRYAYFSNMNFKYSAPSYDSVLVQAREYASDLAGTWTPSAFGTINTTANTNPSYAHDLTSYTDTAMFDYRVKFKNDGVSTAYSNIAIDTFIVSTPSGNINFADYYLVSGSTSTWALGAADSALGVCSDTLEAHVADIGTGKTISVKDTNIGSLILDGVGGRLNNLTLQSYYTDTNGVITLYDTLRGSGATANWVDKGDSSYQFQFTTAGWSDSTFGIHKLWLDDKEYQEAIKPSLTGYTTYGIEDSAWASYGDSVRWLGMWGESIGADSGNSFNQLRLKVWTPDGTNPASYYTSIKQAVVDPSRGVGLTNSSYACKLENIDNLTVEGLTFDGGDYVTLEIMNCDNFTIDDNLVRKVHTNGIRAINSEKGSITDNVVEGFTGIAGDNVWYEYMDAQQGIDVAWESDSITVRGNTVRDMTSYGIRAIGRDGVGHGTPDYCIIDSNDILNTEGLKYFRGIGSIGLTTVAQPEGVIITRNLVDGQTVGSYIGSKDLTVAFNVMEGADLTTSVVIDHKEVKTSNDGYAFEALYALGEGITYLFNNTFYNMPYYLIKLYTNGINTSLILNNLMVNNNRLRSSSDIDLSIESRSGEYVWVKNNLSWNDNSLDSNAYYVTSGLYYSWANFNIAELGSDVFSGNAYSGESTIGAVLDVSNYEAKTNDAIGQGTPTTSYLPSWLTKDRSGNTITGTGDNIGAINND